MTPTPIIVTGASSGIGASVATALTACGHHVIGTGRRTEALRALKDRLGDGFEFHTVDLSSDLAVDAFTQSILDEHSSVGALIHCAGLLQTGAIDTIPRDALDRMIAVNFRAPFLLTSAFADRLAQARGHVIFINSSAGLQAAAGNAAYCASKFALRALADASRLEFNQRGIRVTNIFPGRTATPTMETLYASEGREYRPELLLQPADVAKAVLNVIEAPEWAEFTDISMRPRFKSY